MTGKSFGVAEFRWRAPNTGSPDRTGAGSGPRIPKERVHENRGRQGQCREAKPLGGIRQKLLAGGLEQIFHTKEYQ